MSCELISGYELELFIHNPQNFYQSMNQKLVRHIGANATYYIIKDEDKLEGREATHVRVLYAVVISLCVNSH